MIVITVAVFPAPAGINRLAGGDPLQGLCVPRASGDKPGTGILSGTLPGCSPRQRG
ncbi:hypothetical protein HRL69_001300 [Salmonella enterica]|nr:hypothetical protein [Salmonella enterica]